MLYGELAKNDPYWRQYLVDYLPIKEKSQIKQELSQVQQVGSENEKLKQAMNILQAEMQRLYQETQAKDKQIEITKFKSRIDETIRDFEATVDKASVEYKADLEVAKAKHSAKLQRAGGSAPRKPSTPSKPNTPKK